MSNALDEQAQKVEAHGMTWLVASEFAQTLPRLDFERLRHPELLTDGERVKDNLVRTVARLPDPDRPDGPGLYVKRFKFARRAERLKHLLLPTKPRVEWRACRALQRAGIPTCDVLATAVRRRSGLPREGFLVCREVEGTVSLPVFVREGLAEAEAREPGYGRQLVEELATLTARLLAARLYHHDYHAGNLLIRPEAAPGERLFVVDLHSIHRRRPTRRRVLRMLGMLTRSLELPGASKDDYDRFLRAFLPQWRGAAGASEAALARWSDRLARAQRRQHRRHMHSRTRRCLLHSTLFTLQKAGGFLVHRRRDFPLSSALDAVWCHTDAVRGSRPEARVLRKGLRTEVTVCPCDAVPPFDRSRPAPPELLSPGEVCVKSFRRDPLIERLKDLLRRRSRAKCVWVAARGMRVRGVPAARPLALLESRHKLSGTPDYVVMEALDSDGTLGELASAGTLEPADVRRLGRAAARLLNLLADQEVYHPDTKPNNILVKRTGGEFQLWLVDLDRARFNTTVTRRRWIKCLARLNAGLPGQVGLLDRMRCLRRCSRGRWSRAERLHVARQVYALSLTRRVAWKT